MTSLRGRNDVRLVGLDCCSLHALAGIILKGQLFLGEDISQEEWLF